MHALCSVPRSDKLFTKGNLGLFMKFNCSLSLGLMNMHFASISSHCFEFKT